jgi:hypothetical protein
MIEITIFRILFDKKWIAINISFVRFILDRCGQEELCGLINLKMIKKYFSDLFMENADNLFRNNSYN